MLAATLTLLLEEASYATNWFAHEAPEASFGMLVCPEQLFALLDWIQSSRDVVVGVVVVAYRADSVSVCSTVHIHTGTHIGIGGITTPSA